MVDGTRKHGLRLTFLEVAPWVCAVLAIVAMALALVGCDDSSQPLPGDAAGIVSAVNPHDAGAE
jgi:hypothetical protein